MTKREKIQEAYGKVFEHYSEFIDENGWIKKLSLIPSFNVSNIEFSGLKQRPKSLQGIENNNGWIKIESESDLPTNTQVYHHGIMNGEVICFKLQHPLNLKRLYKDFQKDNVTHYQPIVKPELPIY